MPRARDVLLALALWMPAASFAVSAGLLLVPDQAPLCGEFDSGAEALEELSQHALSHDFPAPPAPLKAGRIRHESDSRLCGRRDPPPTPPPDHR